MINDPSFGDLEASGSDLSVVSRLVRQREKSTSFDRTVTFGLSSNITVDMLGTFLRKHALLHGHRANIGVGNLNDHVGNAKRFADENVDALVLVDFADATTPALEARVRLMGLEVGKAHVERYRAELSLALAEAQSIRHVFVSDMHRASSPSAGRSEDDVDHVISLFNEAIHAETARYDNVRVVHTGALASEIGRRNAHDVRSYRRFLAPLTPAFFDAYASELHLLTRGFESYFYKALILDCDNTLWGGILGEDLAEGIKLSPHGYPAGTFWEIQHEYLGMQRKGVLLCLCTRNNADDVDAVLASHPHMVLRAEHFVAKQVNWEDKATNLRRLAIDLGLGLESFVFVDDSPFECEAVRAELPMVKTMQVPESVAEYPRLVAQIRALFAIDDPGPDNVPKTDQYRMRAQAMASRQEYATHGDYLASLELKVAIARNAQMAAPRIAELTQKSNQFNLTTNRYSLSDVRSLMVSGHADVYSISVSDRFGDSGLTGVLIMRYPDEATAAVDTFLLSCRILGRGVETSLWGTVVNEIHARGCRVLVASYLPTAKNGQVRDFWLSIGLRLDSEDADGRRVYRADLSALRTPSAEHIEVIHES